MIARKECECGCGRVGYFQKYFSNACRQRAYRKRKVQYIDVKAKTVSSWLIDMFGEEECKPIFDELNSISGNKATAHIDNALEQLVYLFQSKLAAAEKKGRRIPR